MADPKTGLSIAALCIVAAATWYLARSSEPVTTEVETVQNASDRFYMRSPKILGTSITGAPLYHIEATYAEQGNDANIELNDVTLSYMKTADIPWVIQADTASLSDTQNSVTLSGNVIARSEAGFAGETTELHTNELTIMPGEFRAETTERVRIRIGERSLSAIGMLALLQENELHLQSNVSGKFTP